MTAATELLPTNRARLVATRLKAQIAPAAANRIVAPDGAAHVMPGQGGVISNITLGAPAGASLGDHVEPGLSLGHPEPEPNMAIRLLACVGNRVTMLDGPAAGATGMIYGKHGAVLAAFPADAVAAIAPGEWVSIDAIGVGLALDRHPDLMLHSCSPDLLAVMVRPSPDGRIAVRVATTLPAVAAAAGLGMTSSMFNMDLNTDASDLADRSAGLRFGDLVAVADQDHRFGRQYRKGWTMVGVISHGTALGGGHGIGLMTLLSAPTDALVLDETPEANVGVLLAAREGERQ